MYDNTLDHTPDKPKKIYSVVLFLLENFKSAKLLIE